jgi:hypothetical protein
MLEAKRSLLSLLYAARPDIWSTQKADPATQNPSNLAYFSASGLGLRCRGAFDYQQATCLVPRSGNRDLGGCCVSDDCWCQPVMLQISCRIDPARMTSIALPIGWC